MVLWLAACNYATVDDACRDHVRGESHGSDAAIEVVGRISCYRTFVGLDRGDIDKKITEAVDAHASYLSTSGQIASTGDWWSESAGTAGYTGVDAFERLYASEYLVNDVGSAFVWQVLLPVSDVVTRPELIDLYMDDPFVRDVFLAPAWEGAGYAEGTDALIGPFAYMNIVLYYPSGARSTRPVVYPQDGQVDVPTRWTLNDPGEPAFVGLPPVVGYPITFTFGSSQVSDGANPLQVSVLDSVITGPSGPVDHAVALPGVYGTGVNWSTAILVPSEPLEPLSEYTVEATFQWIDIDSRKEKLVFTTADDEAPASSTF
ncbi:MAG: hypothetical protein ABMB14_32380 [Myxococcota bacterium]